MKGLFGKYWHVILISVIILLLAFTVLVQNTKDTNDLAKWTFDFLDDWATVLSAAVTLMLAIAAFWAIAENRRIQAESDKIASLDRISS